MISKPPGIGDKEPKDWVREFLGYFENVRFEFMRVRGVWFPAQSNDVHGSHPGEQIVAGGSAYIGGVLPHEFNEVKEVVVRLIPTVSGTIDWSARTFYGGKNEDESANTATASATGLSVTDDRITEVDVTSLYGSLDRDDQIGFNFNLDAVTTTTDVYVLGLYIKYR